MFPSQTLRARQVVASLSIFAALGVAAFPADTTAYVFAYFKGNGDGLHLATSDDGFHWTAVNNDQPVLQPQIGGKLMRDPSICRGPDGVFHLVWTTGWWDQGIGTAQSPDLIHWTAQQEVPVMAHETGARNAWAPEIFYDDELQQFLIFWATSIPSRYPATDGTGDQHEGAPLNHRLYLTTTKDFKDFAPAKLFYNDGFSVIDAFIVKAADKKFVMVMKDETLKPAAKKNLRIATAEHAAGPFGHAGAPFSPAWVEGPTMIRVGDVWVVYFDEYRQHRYGAMQTKDFEKWEDISDKISLPDGIRHGTALAVPPDVAAKLKEAKF